MNKLKFERLLGIARKAGRLVIGTDLVTSALASGKPKIFMVLASEGASDNTKKRISDRCLYYNVTHHTLAQTPNELSHLLGKTGSVCCIGVTDEAFAKGLTRYLTSDDLEEDNE
jgi:ribosomal protein L7Ae-like RNA K-turn-binding protein